MKRLTAAACVLGGLSTLAVLWNWGGALHAIQDGIGKLDSRLGVIPQKVEIITKMTWTLSEHVVNGDGTKHRDISVTGAPGDSYATVSAALDAAVRAWHDANP